jgi:D-methionine transport system ATP-binding protein
LKTLLQLAAVSLTGTIAQHPILSSLSLDIYPGEFIGLVGPSGAGKTSLLKLMNRLQEPTTGHITFRDQPLSSYASPTLRRHVMLVAQQSRLLNMRADQALQYPLTLQKLSASDCQTRVREWVHKLQIPHEWLDKTELELSGGQQQQIAIARALVTRPAVLLLDEPTSALDVGAATRILSVIRTEINDRGLSVVMSNHQLDLVELFCDRLLYLEQGHLRHDQPTSQTNWPALRQALVDADAKEREDWGDDW